MSPAQSSPTAPRPTKRKKPLSCGECRRLKLKCELKFPCGHCVKRGLGSICPDGKLVNGSRRTKILASTQDLHDRIAALEEALKKASSASHPLLEDALYANREEVEKTNGANGNGDNEHTPGSSSSGRKHSRSPSPVSRGGPLTSTALFPPPPASAYGTRVNPNPLDFTDLGPPCCKRVPADASYIARNFLPTREIGHSLAETYFSTFGWYTQIVLRSRWDTDLVPHVYSDMTTLIKPQKLALVLLVYALGALMEPSKAPHSDMAKELFSGARGALSVDTTHSVTYVQCIYLYFTYLLNDKEDAAANSEDCWPLLRMGLAIAEAIGLHRDAGNWNLDDERALERRVVFWEMLTCDMQQSISLSRAVGIPESAIDCKLPDTPEIQFNRKCFELNKIIRRINVSLTDALPATYSQVSSIDAALDAFQRTLPAQFLPTGAPSLLDMSDPLRQRAAFQRYQLLLLINEAKLALHRVWFMSILEEVSTDPLTTPLSNSYLACLEACREIVSLVRNILSLKGEVVQRQWSYYSHLFSACVCLAASAIRAPSSSLAKAVLSELEAGILLFQMSNRSEVATLQRLRDKAAQAIAGSAKAVATEELDLLGARTFMQSASSRQPSSQIQPPLPLAWGILSSTDGTIPATADTFNPLPVNTEGVVEWPNFEMEQFLNDFGPTAWE
ncbi:putative transcriptional regulatory protein [Vanrija pseudolonga]|uniref:Purtative transcriptional regulatory protein n=1 Tax=Vanrija pseudolonga TaxID=143232 RepID=A0AAF0YH33_9TREE|nr:purtative transcriptional regulatory protein [Vanrija pseudolonga]